MMFTLLSSEVRGRGKGVGQCGSSGGDAMGQGEG